MGSVPSFPPSCHGAFWGWSHPPPQVWEVMSCGGQSLDSHREPGLPLPGAAAPNSLPPQTLTDLTPQEGPHTLTVSLGGTFLSSPISTWAWDTSGSRPFPLPPQATTRLCRNGARPGLPPHSESHAPPSPAAHSRPPGFGHRAPGPGQGVVPSPWRPHPHCPALPCSVFSQTISFFLLLSDKIQFAD